MLKQLTIAVLTAALLPACILTTDNTSITDSNSSESATTGTTDGGTVGNTDTDPSVSGTGTDTDANTSGTTDEPTSSSTDTPTTEVTTGTSEATEATDTGESDFGQCGWQARMNFYACAADGATPGAEDPLAEAPIACAADVVAGEKCDDENGPVGSLGCCTPTGDLFYCNVSGDNTIATEACGL